MTKTIHAVYEHGVFKPLEPVEGIEENTELDVTVSIGEEVSNTVLKFAGVLSDDEAAGMMKTVDEEFERINLNEWKDQP